MSDFKSKLPDLKEVSEITGKLFKDIKTSVSEIITNYKKKREDSETTVVKTETTTTKEEVIVKNDKPTAEAKPSVEPAEEKPAVEEPPVEEKNDEPKE